MVAVTAANVRGRLNLPSGVPSDTIVNGFLDAADAEIGAVIRVTVAHGSCTQLQANAIIAHAALKCLPYATSSFQVGDTQVSQNVPKPDKQDLIDELNRALNLLKPVPFRSAEAEAET